MVAAQEAAEAALATAEAAKAAVAAATLAEQSAAKTASAARLVIEDSRASLVDATADSATADIGEAEALAGYRDAAHRAAGNGPPFNPES